jgi:hypothetical protein
MYGFVLYIDVVVGDVRPVKLFGIEDFFVQFFLFAILAHEFEEDRPVAMEDGIDTNGRFYGYFIEFNMILRLAGG